MATMFKPWKYVSDEALEKIAKEPGKYTMEDNSSLSAVLNHFWNWTASKMVCCQIKSETA